MRKERIKALRPWLTPTGVEIETGELRAIAASWDAATWASYLNWFESKGREKLVVTKIYDKIGDEQTESIFGLFAQNTSQENRDQCEQELLKLPLLEAVVLKKYFIEGRTEAEIGSELHRSRTGISKIKIRALSRLKRGNRGDEVSLCQYMKGENSFLEESSIWDEPLNHRLKKVRSYNPNAHAVEFDQVKATTVRAALLQLTDTAQRILYLRYWCGFSVNQTARGLGLGANIIEQIESASISKVKRNAIEFELGITLGGSQCF